MLDTTLVVFIFFQKEGMFGKFDSAGKNSELCNKRKIHSKALLYAFFSLFRPRDIPKGVIKRFEIERCNVQAHKIRSSGSEFSFFSIYFVRVASSAGIF